MSSKDTINKLNEIRSSEERMALVYRQCAAMVTGPYRDSLASEFKAHAKDEDKHANIAMRHIIALGGDLDTDVKNIPNWRNLNEVLAGLDELEEKGIYLWQDLMNSLSPEDAFRHTVEDVLSVEQSHYDDVKRWRRTDFATEKSMNKLGDLGSPVPLNLHLRKEVLPSPVIKSESHDERIFRASRAGTPVSRWGMYNGAVSATSPGVPESLNPPLILKAVRDPALAGGHAGDKTPRKRDEGGKFTTTETAGPQSTAEEDLEQRTRAAKLAEGRYFKALNEMGGQQGQGQGQQPPQLARPKPVNPMQQAGVPGGVPGHQAPVGAMGAASNVGTEMPMGNTPDGLPVYNDPYHPSHANFTPEQHQAAAELHNQQAEMHTNTGRIPTALDHQLKARIHGDLASDNKSPMERVLARQGMPGTAQGQPNQMGAAEPKNPMDGAGPTNPMDDFLTQMGDKNPAAKNDLGDQNKPNFGSPQQNQGPLPRMTDTRTGSPVGQQSQSMSHAGTVSQPQATPPEPAPQNGSMPEISGPTIQETPTGAMDWDPKDFEVDAMPASGGGHQGPGASEAPPSHAGAASQPGPMEGIKPTPGATESGPPTKNPGPSVADKTPYAKREASAESGAFTGNPVEEKAKETRAVKSFRSWFDSI